MARKDKPLELRTVDDSTPEPAPAIRLDNRETELRAREPKPVRLGPSVLEAGVSRRLELPDRDEVELRTHQPDIDVLIEAEASNADQLEEQWGEATIRRHPIPWGWFVLISLAIIGAVLWSLSRVEEADVKAVVIRTETQSALVDEEAEEREAAQLIDRIDKALRNFAAVTSVESLARLVRQPERVLPLMRLYYADKPVYCGPLKSIKKLQPITLGNRGNFWVATVVLGDGEAHSLVLEIGDSGKLLVDWETFVCYQPMKWDDFAIQRPAGTSLDLRVYAETDNFHSHEFADADQWVCFRLTALDGEETLFGYARTDSPEAQEILSTVRTNQGGRVSLILRLGIPEGLKSRRGVVIEKVLSPLWLYMDPPDSGS